MKIAAVGIAAVLIGFAMVCFQVPQQLGWFQAWLLLCFIVLSLFVALPAHMARLEREAADHDGR